MIRLLFGFFLSANSLHAADFYQLLEKPSAERVHAFRSNKQSSYAFLGQAAFDKRLKMQTRWRAITTMGRLDCIYFRPWLERALQSPEWFMRNSALIAIQSDERTRAVKWSTRLVADPALVVRTQAVRNLIQLNARESEGTLWKQIFSRANFRGRESLWIRAHLAEALAKFTGPGEAKSFERLLMEPDERLHKWAILGLENTTGFKTGDKSVPLDIQRREWLARLGAQEI